MVVAVSVCLFVCTAVVVSSLPLFFFCCFFCAKYQITDHRQCKRCPCCFLLLLLLLLLLLTFNCVFCCWARDVSVMDSSSSISSIHFVCCLCRTVNFKMREKRGEKMRALAQLWKLFLLLFLTAFCSYLFISFQWWGEHVEDVEDIYKKCWLIWLPACLPLTREGCVMCCDVFFCVVLCSDLLKNDGMKRGENLMAVCPSISV